MVVSRGSLNLSLLLGATLAVLDAVAGVRGDLALRSAYVRRGITLTDGVVLQPALCVEEDYFGAGLHGNADLGNAGDLDESGLFTEILLDAALKLPVENAFFRLGYSEYVRAAAEPDTREVYAAFEVPYEEGFSIRFGLYYDIGAYDDIYGMLGGAYHLDLADDLRAALRAGFGYAGEDISPGPRGGMHEYTLGAGLVYRATPADALRADIDYFGSLDEEVLPEQDVQFVFGVEWVHDI